jgi:hypothetical protein
MQIDPLSENCIFHISPMYEFSHSLGQERTIAPQQSCKIFDVHPNQITPWKAPLEGRAADFFGPSLGKGGAIRRSMGSPWLGS